MGAQHHQHRCRAAFTRRANRALQQRLAADFDQLFRSPEPAACSSRENDSGYRHALESKRHAESKLRVGLRMKQHNQYDTHHGEHAECRVLAVPQARLPHQKPFPANRQKRHEPHQHRQGEPRDADSLRALERVRIPAQCAEQCDRSPPEQYPRNRFPRDDSQVENEMNRRRVDRAPQSVIPWKRGIHHQHMPHEFVVRSEIGNVVEHHQRVIDATAATSASFAIRVTIRVNFPPCSHRSVPPRSVRLPSPRDACSSESMELTNSLSSLRPLQSGIPVSNWFWVADPLLAEAFLQCSLWIPLSEPSARSAVPWRTTSQTLRGWLTPPSPIPIGTRAAIPTFGGMLRGLDPNPNAFSRIRPPQAEHLATAATRSGACQSPSRTASTSPAPPQVSAPAIMPRPSASPISIRGSSSGSVSAAQSSPVRPTCIRSPGALPAKTLTSETASSPPTRPCSPGAHPRALAPACWRAPPSWPSAPIPAAPSACRRPFAVSPVIALRSAAATGEARAISLLLSTPWAFFSPISKKPRSSPASFPIPRAKSPP